MPCPWDGHGWRTICLPRHAGRRRRASAGQDRSALWGAISVARDATGAPADVRLIIHPAGATSHVPRSSGSLAVILRAFHNVSVAGIAPAEIRRFRVRD